jgi:hypothetical protein
MSYLSKDDPRVLLAQYKNGDDSESDVLEDLVDWIENEWDDSTANVDNDKEKTEIEELIRRVVSIINQYGWRNDKTMKVIAKAEQQQLKDWTNSVKGE